MKKILMFLLLITAMKSLAQSPIQSFNKKDFFSFLDSLQQNETKRIELDTNFQIRKSAVKTAEYLLLEQKDSLVSNKSKNTTTNNFIKENRTDNITNLLIKFNELNIPDNTNVERNIAEIKDGYTLENLYERLNYLYFESENASDTLRLLPTLIKEQNLKLITDRMGTIDERNYMYFTSYYSKSYKLKGFEMYHDNDFLILLPNMNQDREYTGGFKFIAITDYFKWRWFRLGFKEKEDILTYQTISLGGSGFTPYIRYRNNYELADTMHNYDRPFASNIYLERAKHRTWRNGIVRQRGELQIGSIGISQGRKIQAQLHKDVIHQSQYVYGWDKQIADGGRLIIQLNQKVEVLLYSSTNKHPSVFKLTPNQNFNVRKYAGCNLIFEGEAKFGSLMTATGFGIRFSTLDLLKQSGNNMIMSKPKPNKKQFGWKIDLGLNYRYVIHNSMLEGIGFWNTFPEDPYDKIKPDYYVLKENEIERNMFLLDMGICIKFRKTTVFFRQTIQTLEYESRLESVDFQDPKFTSSVDPKDIKFYNETIVQEQNSFINYKVFGRTIYGYGTLGISWIID